MKTEYVRGMILCENNANRLIEASKILAAKKYFGLAIFLLCTAVEEIGKILHILEYRENTFLKNKKSLKIFKQSFFDHKPKLKEALSALSWDDHKWKYLNKVVEKDSITKDNIVDTLIHMSQTWKDNSKKIAKELFIIRNDILYVGFKDGKFSSPKQKGLKQKYSSLLDQIENLHATVMIQKEIGMFAIKRGITRERYNELFLEGLPKMMEIMLSRIKQKRNKVK